MRRSSARGEQCVHRRIPLPAYPHVPFRGTVHLEVNLIECGAAEVLLAGGADIQVVTERMRHSSITTTQKFLHTLPNADHAAVTALNTMVVR